METKSVSEQATTPWRCYHCNEVFTDKESAGEHFGRNEYSDPICKIDAAKYREMEKQVRRANEDDSETDRKMYGLQAKHRAELRSEEERGYARGLHDAKTHPTTPNQALWQPIDTAPATPAAILLLTTSRTMKIETGHWARNMVYASKSDGDDCFYTHWMPLPNPPIDDAKSTN